MKIVYLYSGGLDSAIMVAQAWDERNEYLTDTVELLYIRTTSPYARREERMARRLLRLYGIQFPFRIIDARPTDKRTTDMTPGSTFTSAFVPARNLTFASLAVSFLDADIIRMAGVKDDNHIDSTTDAYKVISSTLSMLSQKQIIVESPFFQMTKTEMVKDFISRDKARRTRFLLHTFSCYKGGRKPCGVCPACKRRAEALISNKILKK